MLGDPAVGKTSLVRKFVDNMFDDKYLSTGGARPVKKEVKVGDDNLTMMIWDIAGHSHSLHPIYYSGAKGALLICDITRRSTADALMSWHSSLVTKVGEVPLKILVNKSDLFDKDFELDYVSGLGYEAVLTSAKTGENVEEAFSELAEMMLNG